MYKQQIAKEVGGYGRFTLIMRVMKSIIQVWKIHGKVLKFGCRESVGTLLSMATEKHHIKVPKPFQF